MGEAYGYCQYYFLYKTEERTTDELIQGLCSPGAWWDLTEKQDFIEEVEPAYKLKFDENYDESWLT